VPSFPAFEKAANGDDDRALDSEDGSYQIGPGDVKVKKLRGANESQKRPLGPDRLQESGVTTPGGEALADFGLQATVGGAIVHTALEALGQVVLLHVGALVIVGILVPFAVV